MTIGWAVVSTGAHPDTKLAPAISTAKDSKLVAVYSRDMDRAEAFAVKHNAQAAYDSVEELLADTRVDAVLVASPTFLHASHAKMAAVAKKHVLVEKPMTITAEEAVEVIETCRHQGVKLGVGFHLRWHPGHIEARRVIQDDLLGTIALSQGQWGYGTRGIVDPPQFTGLHEWRTRPEMAGYAGAMTGMGVHVVDLLCCLLGQEVVEIAAITDGQTLEKPLDALATMCLRFNKGTLGMVCCGRKLPDSRNDATVYGSNGRITLSGSLSGSLGGKLEVVSDTMNNTVPYPGDDLALVRLEVEAFNYAIQKDGEPAASGLDGLRSVQTTMALVESTSTGKRVKLEQPRQWT